MKRVLITGASSGIGAATAELLRSQGCSVLGLDLRAEGQDVIACDVRDQASVDAAVATAVDRLGGVDVLINCAGVGFPQGAGVRPDDAALAVIDINLIGPWRVTAAALDALLASRGRIVNISSGLAFLTLPFATAYTMSKRGIVGYSDALRLEYAGALEVTSFYPGYVRTPIHQASAEFGVTLEGMVPAEELADCAAALARAATGPYQRDAATSTRANVSYVFLRTLPRRLLDRGVVSHMRKQARKGGFDGNPAGAQLAQRLAA